MDKLYEVTLVGQYNGQEHVNRFNYVATGSSLPTGTAFALVSSMGLIGVAGAFTSGIGNNIVALVRAELEFNQTLCRAVYDPTDFVDVPHVPTVPGTVDAVKANPATVAYGFRTNRVRADISRGTRRFAGVESDFFTDINILTAPCLTIMNGLADAMSAVLTTSVAGVSVTFTPCVVKKHKYTTPRGNAAYRYNTTAEGGETAQMANLAVGVVWSPYATLRTQNSRQTGKGR